MNPMRYALVALLALANSVSAGQVDDFIAQAAQIVTNDEFTLTAQIGDGALLRIDGYQAGTNRAFRIAYEERELLRAVNGALFLTPSPTAGPVRIDMPFPLHITTGYNNARDISLGFGAMPPAERRPFVLLSYGGLPGRLAGLAEEPLPSGGRRYVDDLNAGKCIEVVAATNRISVTFVQPTATGGLMIHEVALRTGANPDLPPLPAGHTVAITNFVQALTFLARTSSTLLRIPGHGIKPDEAMSVLDTLVKKAEAGIDDTMPPMPPSMSRGLHLPGAPVPGALK